MRSLWRDFLVDEDAVTASEYAIMLVLIIVVVIAAVTAVGHSTAQGWTNDVNAIIGAGS